jgi:hypothetical protein
MRFSVIQNSFLILFTVGFSLSVLGQVKTKDSILVHKYNKPIQFNVGANSGLLSQSDDNERTDFTVQRSISFRDTTGKKDIEFTVNESTSGLGMLINCRLEQGSVAIEIRDPEGNKKGVFQLDGATHSSSEWREQVSGKIAKEFMNPIKGVWKIRISANKATAIMDARVQQQ